MLGSGSVAGEVYIVGRGMRQSKQLDSLTPGLPPLISLPRDALRFLPQPLQAWSCIAQTKITYILERTLSYFQCPLDWMEPSNAGTQAIPQDANPAVLCL